MKTLSILDLVEVRRLIVEVARRDYSEAELAKIVRGWKRDLRRLIKRKRRKP